MSESTGRVWSTRLSRRLLWTVVAAMVVAVFCLLAAWKLTWVKMPPGLKIDLAGFNITAWPKSLAVLVLAATVVVLAAFGTARTVVGVLLVGVAVWTLRLAHQGAAYLPPYSGQPWHTERGPAAMAAGAVALLLAGGVLVGWGRHMPAIVRWRTGPRDA
ncbi:tryptophan-associated transmembrane protein [Herbihabitans rhizosphaerae]|uniref:Tryptophan-associated transmembrane protein n=1 Tax=Herbihabitans rhizosphaerae TaxID=1872711 RepID=A0A4Q7KHC1_9PSEU|nr:Trp biosynthesis-associated membrane protein [Herbihabitans rhizosphaerae]RZS34300.1 tryptophan-associated transmembrane protein [Herbihabitans rhizosphaerae]